ncbi:MAG: O-antigen ligase family protein [Magnetococcales bacterium]|nr:O-antigen ligase family protein [Magnetococcales bacterium]
MFARPLDLHSKSPRYLFKIYLSLIFWLPIPLGSNRAWAWSIMEIWIFAICLIWLYLHIAKKLPVSPAFKKCLPIIIIWSIWFVVSTIQFIQLPSELVAFLSPNIAAIYQSSEAWGEVTSFPLSVTPYASRVEWLKGLSYLLIFIMTLLLVESRNRLRKLAWAMVITASLQAVIGILFLFSDTIFGQLFSSPHSPPGAASGTFINRNHFANFLVMNLAVGTGLLISGVKDEHRKLSFKALLTSFLKLFFSYKAPLRILLVIIVIGVILSRSRMGNTSLLLSLSIAGMFALYSFKVKRRTMALLLISFLVVDLFFIGKWVGLEKVVERIEQTQITQTMRLPIFQDSLKMVGDHWLFGAGMGSFPTLFPRYKSFEVAVSFSHADNDYIEIMAETGVLGLLFLGVPALISLFMGFKVLLNSKDPLFKGFSFASIMGVIAMLIHALTDFNLHIPANAAIFMILLAFPWILQGETRG